MPPRLARFAPTLSALLLAALLAGCGGSGDTSSTASGASPSPDAGSGSGGTGGDTQAGEWTLSTGAHPADLVENLAFQTLTIGLESLSVATTSTSLHVSTRDNVTTVTYDGAVVATVAPDAYGVTIQSSAPASLPLAFALSGAYQGSVTIHSDQDFRLDLADARIASSDGPALNVQSKARAFVVLAGSNTLSAPATWSARHLGDGTTAMDLKAAFFGEGPLILSGTGSLGVTALARHALASDAHVRVRSGVITLDARAKDGIRANDAFVLDGGTLTIRTASGAGKGIKVEGKEDDTLPLGFIVINGGTLDIDSYDKGITASWEAEDGKTGTLADDPDPFVTINGGTLTIHTSGQASDDLSPEGIESKSTLTINGGLLTLTTDDDALNAGTALVVNGGRIYAKSTSNDAVDSNGTLTITGGVLVALGAGRPEGGLDADQNTFTVTGGTFVGAGGSNSTPTRSTTTQPTISLANLSSGTLVIRDTAGNAAFAYDLPQASAAVLLSAPALRTGTTYTVYRNGTLGTYEENFHGLYLGATTHAGGSASGSSFTLSSTVTSR